MNLMRKLVALLAGASLVVIISLFFAGNSFAEEGTNSERSPKPSFRALEVRRDIKESRENNVASREAKFCEMRKGKIKSYLERMLGRLSALVERLQKLIDRIESRIDKIEASEETIDLTGPKADLASAKTNLADAKIKLDSLNDDIDDFLTCDDPKGAFKTVREKVDEIKDDLKEVHRLLVHIIGNIKGLRVGESEQ